MGISAEGVALIARNVIHSLHVLDVPQVLFSKMGHASNAKDNVENANIMPQLTVPVVKEDLT